MQDLKVGAFICDVGNGHLIRTKTVINELIRHKCLNSLAVFCGNNVDTVKKELSFAFDFGIDVEFIISPSHVNWFPREDGSPNTEKIINHLKTQTCLSMLEKLSSYSEQISKFDFILNDGFPVANKIGHQAGIPTFNTFHFTWSWFYAKCYPVSLITSEIAQMFEFEKLATKNFIMPFTPSEIKSQLPQQVDINFITETFKIKKNTDLITDKQQILIIDSGFGHSSSTINLIQESLSKIAQSNVEISLFGSGEYASYPYVKQFDFLGQEEIQHRLQRADLIVARPGFNLLTELLNLQKRAVFFYEKGNPEMIDLHYQLRNFSQFYFVNNDDLQNLDFWQARLSKDVTIKEKLLFNGASQIVHHILESLNNGA
jgi:hypothetical protein